MTDLAFQLSLIPFTEFTAIPSPSQDVTAFMPASLYVDIAIPTALPGQTTPSSQKQRSSRKRKADAIDEGSTSQGAQAPVVGEGSALQDVDLSGLVIQSKTTQRERKEVTVEYYLVSSTPL